MFTVNIGETTVTVTFVNESGVTVKASLPANHFAALQGLSSTPEANADVQFAVATALGLAVAANGKNKTVSALIKRFTPGYANFCGVPLLEGTNENNRAFYARVDLNGAGAAAKRMLTRRNTALPVDGDLFG